MRSASSILLAAAAFALSALAASAADFCDTAKATQSGNVKLFAVTMTRFSGIFQKGDCTLNDDGVLCARTYDQAGVMELFGADSGILIAGVVGTSLQQCGFLLEGEFTNTTSEDVYFALDYYTETVDEMPPGQEALEGLVTVAVVVMNDGNFRVEVELER